MSKDGRTIFIRLGDDVELTHDEIASAILRRIMDEGSWQEALEAMAERFRLKESTIATALAESASNVHLKAGNRIIKQRVLQIVSSYSGIVQAEVTLKPRVEEPTLLGVKRY